MPVRMGSSLLLFLFLSLVIPGPLYPAFLLLGGRTQIAHERGSETLLPGDPFPEGPSEFLPVTRKRDALMGLRSFVGGTEEREAEVQREPNGCSSLEEGGPLPKGYRFACHLMERGHWIQAIQEFRRFCYFHPDGPLVPSALLAVGICYERAGRLADAIDSYQVVADRYTDSPVGREAAYRVGEALYRAERFEEARITLEKFSKGRGGDAWMWRARYRAAWASVRLHAFVAAREAFSVVASHENPYREPACRMVKAISEITTLPYRSPALAGSLSGLLPGLGHLYAGAWKDGVLAFLVNGALIAASVEAWHEKVYGAAGLVSVVGLTFYLGNIYGAVNSAHIANEERLEGHLRPFELEYEWWRPRDAQGNDGEKRAE